MLEEELKVIDVATETEEFSNVSDEDIGGEGGGDGGNGNGHYTLEEMDTSDGSVKISAYAQRAYLAYAMSVVKGRALPSIEDGQKPVQRRILFAMKELGNWSNSPYKKSARVIGDVLGKYHPHGDSSVYEAAVRMVQDFTLRYPLIDGQGNFGSRDGDSAAAMRYTEVRLSKLAEEILLADIDRGTVDFADNYDGQIQEPTLLPARLPMMVLNGAMGIAVGMATDILPHNMVEVGMACCDILQRQNEGVELSDDEILDRVPGPDFPGGAQVISSKEEIRKAYSSGRGSLRVRAKWTIEPLARGQWQIAITELPPCSFDSKDLGDRKVTGTARILAEIDEMVSPRLEKGKKVLTGKQQALKASLLSMLDRANDDSDKKNPIRIVLEPKTSKVSPDELMALMMANTGLEGNVKVNMVSLGRDGKPGQKGFAAILREWTGFRMNIIERKLRHRHAEVTKRLHILDGRMIAFLSIERVIKVIREADEPKAELMQVFNLSDVQAEDILEIRLRQLARLEGIKIEQEIGRLTAEKAHIEFLLGSESARRDLGCQEIKADIEKFGDERRTKIEESERVTQSKAEVIVDEALTVVLSKNGFIRCRNGHGIDASTLGWKAGDSALSIVETRSVYPIVLLDSNGRAYSLKSTDIPGGKGDGVPVNSLIEPQGGKILYMLSAESKKKVLISTSGGYGFVCAIESMVSKQKAGKRFLNVSGSEEGSDAFKILEPVYVDGKSKVLTISSSKKALWYEVSEIKELDGGKGVILMGLGDGDELSHVKAFNDSIKVSGVLKTGKQSEFVLNEKTWERWEGKRARKGCNLPVNFVSIELE